MLVRRVLQIAEPAYRRIVETGTNAKGETITSPIDGIGRDGDHFVVLEMTTTDAKKLATKWLALKTKDGEGDLLKAARKAGKIRAQHPGAAVTVVLATNERVDDDLYLDVQQKADTLGVTVDIWDQSRIGIVLDTTPAGHALRLEYLGVQATLVSRELMAILRDRSARSHSATLLTGPNAVPRALAGDLLRGLTRSGISLKLLRGGSGLGKSTAGRHVMAEWNAGGAIALWLSETTLESSNSLHSALEAVLTELNGDPLVEAAESLLALVDDERPLVVLVDDIRQLASPGAALRKLIAWSKPLDGLRPPVVFVVPVWPQMTDEVRTELREASWTEIVEVGTYTREESVERVKTAAMTAADAETFASLLGDDPFLIGRWTDLALRGTEPSAHLARNVLSEFVQDVLVGTAATVPLGDAGQFQQTLVRLSRRMMETRDTHPTAAALREALPERDASLVDILAVKARLLTWRTDAAGRRTIAFRHDRLEDYFFAEAATEILRDGDPAHVIADPYFARPIGMALAGSAAAQLPRVAAEAPLALFEALCFTGDAGRQQPILETASEWLSAREPHFELQRAILQALREAEGDELSALTARLPESEQQRIVRLHHGDASAALAILGTHEFLPAATYKAFENALEHARSRHRAAMIDATKALLVHGETAQRGLELAGYLALPELGLPILECWLASSKDYELTIATLWAAARCCDTDTREIVAAIFDRYFELAEQRFDDNPLNLAFKLPPSPAASAAIVERATALGKAARQHALSMLQRVDHPDVFRMFVEDADDRALNHAIFATDARPSAASRSVLRTLWQSADVHEYGRKAALAVWAASATEADIPALRGLADDPLLAKRIAYIRAKLGDRAAAPALAGIGATDAGRLVWAHRIWSPELRATVESHLQAFGKTAPEHHPNDPHHIARVLRHIPAADAEEMLEKHWEAVRTSPLFIQSAIVVGTPRTIALAHAAVDALTPDVYAFRHVSQPFGLWHTDDSHSRKMSAVPETVLTIRHLAALSEFTTAMRHHQIADVLSAASRRGWSAWLEANFDRWTAHLSAEERDDLRRDYRPSDEDLRADLFELSNDPHAAHHWVRNLTARNIEPRRIIDIAVDIALSKHDPDGWLDTITVLAHIGTRADLTRIEPLLPPDDTIRATFADIAFAIRRRTLQ